MFELQQIPQDFPIDNEVLEEIQQQEYQMKKLLNQAQEIQQNIEKNKSQKISNNKEEIFQEDIKNELKAVRKLYQESIQEERKLQKQEQDLSTQNHQPISKKQIREQKIKIENFGFEIIQKINSLSFQQIGTIHRPKNEGIFIESFDKIWIWLMDVIYNVSWAKYSWADFSQKALIRDKGEELKWRLIILNIEKLEDHQYKELIELVYVHQRILLDKVQVIYKPLQQFFELIEMLIQQKENKKELIRLRKQIEEQEIYKNQFQNQNKNLQTRLALVQSKGQILEQMTSILGLLEDHIF